MTTFKIKITSAAIHHFIDMMKRSYKPCLTLFLKASGCNGYKYEYQFMVGDENSIHYGLAPGFDLYIDRKSAALMTGTTIDYVKDGLSMKLVYDNPLAKGSCGCGESFNF
jgi:iron-sulfur cluster assembly accessory protein